MDSFSRLYMLALAETVCCLLAQLGVLDRSAGSVLGQVELAIRVSFLGKDTA